MADLSILQVSDERILAAILFAVCVRAQHRCISAWQDLQFFQSALPSSSDLTQTGPGIARFPISPRRKDPA